MDGALYTTACRLFTKHDLTPSVSICSPHSNGRLSKRTLGTNLSTYWEEGPAYIEVRLLALDRSLVLETDQNKIIY